MHAPFRLPAILHAAALAVAILLAVPGLIAPAGAAPPLIDPWAEVLPALRDEVEEATRDRLSSYRIAVSVDEDTGTIGGEMTVDFRNDAGVPLGEIWFRLFPNIPYYDEGGTLIGGVTVDGAPAATTLDLDDSALRVDLPLPLPPGGRTEVQMAFTTTVPLGSTGSYGIFQRDPVHDTWVLADWHPVLAVYDRGVGWNLAPATLAGDPTYAASAMFDVRIEAPAGWAVVASGVEVGASPTAPGRVERQIIAGPAREFTVALDDDWTATVVRRGGVTITAWTEPDATNPDHARLAAESAADALDALGERLAPYPFRELDLVDVPLDGALAVSWSGLIFLDSDAMLGRYAGYETHAFETVIAHEVAHLWWGASVGSDSNTHPFMNEGLATVSSIEALRWQQHPGATDALKRWVLDPASRLVGRGDAIVDLPAGAAGDPSMRSWATYAKAALGFLAIRAEIGEEAFWGGLDAISRDKQFGIMTPDDLRAAFEAASGHSLGGLWRRWFDETHLTEAEIAAVADTLDR
jgi:hypothetical protein